MHSLVFIVRHFYFMYWTIQMKACLFVYEPFNVVLLHRAAFILQWKNSNMPHTPVHTHKGMKYNRAGMGVCYGTTSTAYCFICLVSLLFGAREFCCVCFCKIQCQVSGVPDGKLCKCGFKGTAVISHSYFSSLSLENEMHFFEIDICFWNVIRKGLSKQTLLLACQCFI